MRGRISAPYCHRVKLLDRVRTTPLDAALAGVFLVAGLVQVAISPIASPGLGELFVVGSTLPLAWRRTFPVEAALVSAAFWFIPLDGFPVLGFVVVLLQFFALGHRGVPDRAVVGVVVVASATSVVGTLLGPEEPVAIITALLTIVAPTVAGRLLRREQRRNQALLDLTEELAAERRRAEEAAVGAERARVAQELHDVVGHEVTLIAIQAEAAAAALRLAPERAAEPVEAIRATAHRTLTEIRGVLDVLAPGGEAHEPSGESVQAVVERARAAGIPSELSVTGAPGVEQTSASLAVNRIVRECLTNAARHAPGQPVKVDVRWTADGVEVRSVNPTDSRRRAEPGRGLTGMRHRAELLGGTFRADSAGGCFDVRVTIPSGARP
jgi:signal transduction histidine kinase